MLSIIIPVYNVASFLERAINSILRQNLTSDYEVILINDGSTDNSESICLHYVQKYPTIFRYAFKKNGGVSSARNMGLELSKGKYVYFMDADDYLIDYGLETLFKTYQVSKYDILYFCSVTVTHRNQRLNDKVTSNGRIMFEGDGIKYLTNRTLNTFVWNMIINKSFLLDNDITFKNMLIAEDALFNLNCLLKANRVAHVSDCIYRYIVRSNSAVTNRNSTHAKKSVECYGHLFKTIYEKALVHRSNDALYSALRKIITNQFTPCFSRILLASYTITQFKNIVNSFQVYLDAAWENKIVSSIKVICKFPFLYKPASFVYRFLFIPFIHPFLSKN